MHRTLGGPELRASAPYVPSETIRVMDTSSYQDAIRRLAEASAAYYRGEESGLDDAEYDLLHAAVVAAEKDNPDLRSEGSVVGTVGHSPPVRKTVAHERAMLSLDNIFSGSELTAWLETGELSDVTVEPKLDGLAISASYHNGALRKILTRGDGTVGEDVTDSPITVAGLPDHLNETVDLEVRGEICMTWEDFDLENDLRSAEGQRPLVNPRNGAAGAVMSLPGRRKVKLSFWAYGSTGLSGKHDRVLEKLRQLGLQVSVDVWSARPGESIESAVQRLGRERAGLPVGIDGAVIKANLPQDRERLGSTGRAPKWAIAYKYPAEMRRSALRSIDLQVGRGGSITPVGRIDAVHVGGAEVSSVNLHNPGDIARKDLRIGDTVWVRRAGDVIPEVVGPDVSARPSDSEPWSPPTECPGCRGPVNSESARLRCVQRCGTLPALSHAAGRGALDIDGAGAELIAAAHASGLIHDVPSLYDLDGRVDELAALEVNGRRFGKARAQRIANAAARARDLPFARHIVALGLAGVGTQVGASLASAYPDVESLEAATPEDLAKVENIGVLRAASLALELKARSAELKRLGARISPAPTLAVTQGASEDRTLEGMRFAITGRLANRSRAELEKEIARRGGFVTSKVTSGVKMLIQGEGGGGKTRDAKAAGVTIVSEEQFESLLEGRKGR